MALAVWVVPAVGDPVVRYVVTVPGEAGQMVALVAEAVMSGGLMFGVLVTSNHPRLARFTGWLAGFLLLSYIAVEAPLSGMSINPARTVGSAAWANVWTALWVYFAAPIGGMLMAAEVYVRWKGPQKVYCAKLNHPRPPGVHLPLPGRGAPRHVIRRSGARSGPRSLGLEQDQRLVVGHRSLMKGVQTVREGDRSPRHTGRASSPASEPERPFRRVPSPVASKTSLTPSV